MQRRNPIPPLCRCGSRAKMVTSWTDDNPARRFAICEKRQGEGCDFWVWVDPEMCSRSTVIIPGLLRKLDRLEAEIRSAEEKAEILEESMKCLKNENAKLHNEVSAQKRGTKKIVAIFVIWLVWVIVSWIKSPKCMKISSEPLSLDGW